MIQVPVFLDSAQASEGLSRCFYFHIEVDETLDVWGLRLGGTSFPFLMIGLTGILYQPADGGDEFTSPDQIASLIALVEEIEGRFVEISYLWLPSKLLGVAEAHRNEAFRVGIPLFTLGVRYRNGGIESPAFIDRALSLRQEVRRSPAETLRSPIGPEPKSNAVIVGATRTNLLLSTAATAEGPRHRQLVRRLEIRYRRHRGDGARSTLD